MNVLILENRDRQPDDDPSHYLFFVEAPDRRQGDYSRAADSVTPCLGKVEDAMREAQESPIWPEGTPAYQPAAL